MIETLAVDRSVSGEALPSILLQGRGLLMRYDLESYENAVYLFREALALDPGCGAALAGLAECYALWGSRRELEGLEAQSYYDSAYECAQKALESAPDSADSHRAMAVALRRGQRADPELRRVEAQRAVELDSSCAANWYERWKAFGSSLSDPSILTAIKLDPDHFAAYHDLAVSLCDAGRISESLRCFRKAVALCPQNSLARYNLAMTLEASGRRDEAFSELGAALAENPDQSLIRRGLEYLRRP